jgi:hypothetical protein
VRSRRRPSTAQALTLSVAGYTQYVYNGIYSGFDFHYCDSKDRGIGTRGSLSLRASVR